MTLSESGERGRYFKALGLCTTCGQREPLPGTGRCAPCREYNIKYQRALYHERIANKLCVDCGKPCDRVIDGKHLVICGVCSKLRVIRKRKRRKT